MKWFDYQAPRTLGEAVEAMTLHPTARALAGGTDLLVQMRAGRRTPDLIVDIKKIPELNQLHYEPGMGLTLGAAVPCYRIYNDTTVSRAYPSLAEVANIIGGTQIQGRASIGGNLCNAAPSADAIPLLIALGATCRILGPGGERTLPVDQFCVAPGQNVLATGELLVSIQIPQSPASSAARYLRFIPRNEMDIAVAGAGVYVVMENGHIQSAKIALSSVAPTPLPVDASTLAGQPADEATVHKAGELAAAAAKPITDMRGTADYRRHLCAVLTRRALASAIAAAKESK
ncbi:MAG: xanthine dehydrogenase family protein subunit M [Bryobacterales bacterium]|nr:xanthine dehydrogenase family protein subunit M [Bryobacterales bacterium]